MTSDGRRILRRAPGAVNREVPLAPCYKDRTGVVLSQDVVVAAAVRTPIGRFGGALASVSAVELGNSAAKGGVHPGGIAPGAGGQTIFGPAPQAGCGPKQGREGLVRARVPPAETAHRIKP